MELGVGSVVQSALYSPLAHNENESVSKIISSANRFFLRIAVALSIYIIILTVIYPLFINQEFDFFYTSLLILSMSISTFAQYYFGVVDRILLSADQKGYIHYTAQAITLALNTIACAVLIECGASIHVVKLITSFIYLLRPAFLKMYVSHHYAIGKRIKYDEEPIKQKWNGIAQHVAAVVLDQTDVLVLTVFSSLENVSIYSVYHLVVFGVKNLFMSLTSGIQSLMGELLAKKETENLINLFDWAEWLLHTGTVLVFGCTGVLIVPFVQIYTKGIIDANYIQPVFAILITIANAGHCLRLPYNILILAAGHYKQTQSNYIIAAVINLVVSILTVKIWGLIGVAIGTMIAMFFQTVWMAHYDVKSFLHTSMHSFLKHIGVDIITSLIAIVLCCKIPIVKLDYIHWLMLAVVVGFIWIVVITIINYFFYPDKLSKLIFLLKERLPRL
ncbi:MAG: polysaccharide biosynthesis C-terminal domain-containing protein [Prevotella sp.]|nr:polysaccharide biosynthesis C-terminal domain-containing protein [Prevotella sp.]